MSLRQSLVKDLSSDAGLVWFRVGDLRLADNPALYAALAEGPVVPFFAWTPSEEGTWAAIRGAVIVCG